MGRAAVFLLYIQYIKLELIIAKSLYMPKGAWLLAISYFGGRYGLDSV
jgi:hypothetical protein